MVPAWHLINSTPGTSNVPRFCWRLTEKPCSSIMTPEAGSHVQCQMPNCGRPCPRRSGENLSSSTKGPSGFPITFPRRFRYSSAAAYTLQTGIDTAQLACISWCLPTICQEEEQASGLELLRLLAALSLGMCHVGCRCWPGHAQKV